MENEDIYNLKVVNIKSGNKRDFTGSITLCSVSDDKAKATYSLDHKCLGYSLKLLGQPCVVTYNPGRHLIVSVRSP